MLNILDLYVKKILIILLFLFTTDLSSQTLKSKKTPTIVIEQMETLAITGAIAEICYLKPTITSKDAQYFGDIANRKDELVDFAMKRFDDENLFIIATDFTPNNRKFYLDLINKNGGCNKSLSDKLIREIETVEYKIRNGNATEVKDANIFHYIIFGAFICACYFSVKFILKLFGIKFDF